ncbi:MAG: hypothetical protein COA81_13080 [Alphaproteobacteria bacterium]|nr:MAG: hypothetical protein COA81_13080 [Alphaproteobacteria bacterium]
MAFDTVYPSVGLKRIMHTKFLLYHNQGISHLESFFNWFKLQDISSKALKKCSENSGVYVFVLNHVNKGCVSPVDGQDIVYIGQGKNLSKRLDNYISCIEARPSQEKRKKILYMLNTYRTDLELWWTEISFQYLNQVEDTLIKTIDPYFNTQDRLPFDLKNAGIIEHDTMFTGKSSELSRIAFREERK